MKTPGKKDQQKLLFKMLAPPKPRGRRAKVERIPTPTVKREYVDPSDPYVIVKYLNGVDVAHSVTPKAWLDRWMESMKGDNVTLEVFTQEEYFVQFRTGRFNCGKSR